MVIDGGEQSGAPAVLVALAWWPSRLLSGWLTMANDGS